MDGASGYNVISIKNFNIEFQRFQYTVMFHSPILVFKEFYSKNVYLNEECAVCTDHAHERL